MGFLGKENFFERGRSAQGAEANLASDSGADQYPQYVEDGSDDSRVVVAAAIAGSLVVLGVTGVFNAAAKARDAVAGFMLGVDQDVRALEARDIYGK